MNKTNQQMSADDIEALLPWYATGTLDRHEADQVEAALASHEAVLEAAVIGKQDADGLIKPKAFIVLRNGFAANENLLETLRVHVKQCAGPWKYPRWIDIRPDLPRTATGKIQRFKLREPES